MPLIPCPKPGCGWTVDPATVPAGGVVTCPRCGQRFLLATATPAQTRRGDGLGSSLLAVGGVVLAVAVLAGVVVAAVLLKKNGQPWLFVDARPVTAADYAAAYPRTKKPSAAIAPQPVRSVPYVFARAYAEVVHKRLLTSDEWDAAIQTPGVIAQSDLFEWVAPAVGNAAPVRAPGKAGTRPQQVGHKDVTFRLALDLRN